VFDTSPRPLAPDRSGLAGRPRAASRAPARRRARPRAPAGCEGKASCYMTPRATTRERPPAPPLRTAWTIGCAGGVAARGRAASPTKRGRYCIDVNALFEKRHFENGTSQVYLPCLLMAFEDYRTVRCSIAPRQITGRKIAVAAGLMYPIQPMFISAQMNAPAGDGLGL
jgi:hypothetical protein